jgi:uncharacterized protein YecT (DUF1311 family)
VPAHRRTGVAMYSMVSVAALIRRLALLAAVGIFIYPSVSAKAQTCSHSANQREWNICAGKEAAASDQRLKQLLAEISSRADSARRVQLAAVQSKWESFRDSDCTWQADAFLGGSIQPAIYSQCITSLTEARISDLKVQLCDGFGATGSCAASRKYDSPIEKPGRS